MLGNRELLEKNKPPGHIKIDTTNSSRIGNLLPMKQQ